MSATDSHHICWARVLALLSCELSLQLGNLGGVGAIFLTYLGGVGAIYLTYLGGVGESHPLDLSIFLGARGGRHRRRDFCAGIYALALRGTGGIGSLHGLTTRIVSD